MGRAAEPSLARVLSRSFRSGFSLLFLKSLGLLQLAELAPRFPGICCRLHKLRRFRLRLPSVCVGYLAAPCEDAQFSTVTRFLRPFSSRALLTCSFSLRQEDLMADLEEPSALASGRRL